MTIFCKCAKAGAPDWKKRSKTQSSAKQNDHPLGIRNDLIKCHFYSPRTNCPPGQTLRREVINLGVLSNLLAEFWQKEKSHRF